MVTKIEDDPKWQEMENALAGLRKELAEIRSAIGGVRALSGSLSQSQELQQRNDRLASESSETGNEHDPTKQKMTFEEFANASGIGF